MKKERKELWATWVPRSHPLHPELGSITAEIVFPCRSGSSLSYRSSIGMHPEDTHAHTHTPIGLDLPAQGGSGTRQTMSDGGEQQWPQLGGTQTEGFRKRE